MINCMINALSHAAICGKVAFDDRENIGDSYNIGLKFVDNIAWDL